MFPGCTLHLDMPLQEAPKNFISATVSRRVDITDDLSLFWLQPSEPVSFKPGQYVTLSRPDESGKAVKRAYSIVSAPHEPEIELVIELVEHGALTPLLWDLKEGDSLWARKKIVGHFLLDEAQTRHVMVCTVTGIAPFMSMMRAHKQARDAGEDVPDHQFLVLFGASFAKEHGPYREQLDAFAEEGWVETVPSVSRPWANPEWNREVGRVGDVLRKHMDRLNWMPGEIAGYACGNPDMIENVKGLLKRAGVAEDHIHEEKYFTTTGEAVPIDLDGEEEKPERPKGPPGGIKLKTVKRE